jgi:hypothetical protein
LQAVYGVCDRACKLPQRSRKHRRDLLQPRPRSRLDEAGCRQEIFVGHAASEICPARGLLLDGEELLGLFWGETTACGAFQTFEIELYLLHQARIDHAPDLEIAVDRLFAFLA